jgi:putative transposase
MVLTFGIWSAASGRCASRWRARGRRVFCRGLERFRRRAAEGMRLIREALLRGLATRQVGRGVAIQTVYPRALHERGWAHKMGNICAAVRRRDHDGVKQRAQRIYPATSLAEAQRAFVRFRWNWQRTYPGRVRRLEKDLPQLLTFFPFARHLWRKLRTTNTIERCFVEARRRTRPMVCLVDVESVDRIIYAIFNGLNDQWRNRILRIFAQTA